MKTAKAIQEKLNIIKIQKGELRAKIPWLISKHRHADASKLQMHESALGDQIALLEWVLKD